MKTKLMIISMALCCISQTFASDKKDSLSIKLNLKYSTDKGIFTGATDHNLIQNPGFENKTSKWSLGKYNGGSGLFTTDTLNPIAGNQSALVITDNQGKHYYDVQLFTFFNLQKKALYSITFKAEVTSNSAISVSVSNGFETFYEAKLF